MDQAERLRRRDEVRRRARRRRQIALAGLLACAAGATALGLAAGAGGGKGSSADAGKEPRKPPQLPRGGFTIFPRYRVVAYYGAPQDQGLGALGIGTPDQAAAKLRRQAASYRLGRKPVMPAFELLGAIASGAPGRDGMYRDRQQGATIARYLAAARRTRALLILDVQPGHADFFDEVRALAPYLAEPDVSLALDPEWHTPDAIPGKVIGSVDAATVNRVSAYLAGIVSRYRLPQKLLVVHQFTPNMIRERARVLTRPGVAVTINVDGFGDPPNKVAKYGEFVVGAQRFQKGFKLFYQEDTPTMSPREVLRLRPMPDLIVYE